MLEDERYQANLKGLLPFVYTIPSYVAHIVVLWAILSRKNKEELGTNFFKIYAYSAITALLSSFFLLLYLRIRYTPCLLFIVELLPERSAFGTFLYMCSFYFIYTELFTSLILNLNRASVVILKARYQRFWRKYLLPIMVILYVGSLIFVIHMIFTDVSFERISAEDRDQGYDWNERKLIPWLQNSVVMLIIVLITCVGSVAGNFYVLVYLIISANNPTSYDETQKGNKDAQKRLFIFTAIMLFNHLAFAVLQVMFTVVKHLPTIYFMLNIQAYVLDFINLSPPWFLLFISPQVRKCVLRMRVIKDVSAAVRISQATPSTVSQIPVPKQQTLFSSKVTA